MTMLLDGRLRDLATQTHLLETKVSSLGWMAGAGAQTLKSMTRAQAHLMLAECDLLDALEANEKKEKNNEQPDRRVRYHRRRSGTGDGRLSGTQSGKRSAVSIISSEAKWAVLQRVVRLSHEEIRGTTKSKEYEAGFIAGATRRPTDEEIVAGAKAFYEALKPDSYPQWDSDCALKAEYYDAMRLAVKAMQGKATEE